MPTAAPGQALDGVGQFTEATAAIDQAIVAAVPGVDVNNDQPLARGDGNVRVRPLRPPVGDDPAVGGRVG